MFIGEVKLSTLAVVMVLMSLLLVTSDNAGGSFAHLGGAFAGWAFAYYLNKGRDLTLLINKTIDFFKNIGSGGFKFPSKPKMRIFKGKRSDDYDYNAQKKEQNADIDKILEKLKKNGYSSLTEEEKKRLFDASKQ